MTSYIHRIYLDRGLPFLLRRVRITTILGLFAALTFVNWFTSRLESRGVITETTDMVVSIAALVIAALLAQATGRFTITAAEDQATLLRDALDEERRTRRELEEELARRGVFIEQANHHLRTPVTVIYGMTQLLAERGDEMDVADRDEFRRVVLANAEKLKGIVEGLSEFLDDQIDQVIHAPR